jgi:integrase
MSKQKKSRYSIKGKIEIPMSQTEFKQGMSTGHFIRSSHRAFVVLLFYYGVRISEATRVKKEQFSVQGNLLFFDVGQRLKHSKKTDALPLAVDAPYVNELIELIRATPAGHKLFTFNRKTGYNIVRRVWNNYPHHFRLTRITGFFQDGRTLTEVKSWTGLSLKALDYYAGKVAILEMGRSLAEQD